MSTESELTKHELDYEHHTNKLQFRWIKQMKIQRKKRKANKNRRVEISAGQ